MSDEKNNETPISGSKEELEKAFRDNLKNHICPNCNTQFTDYAIDWGDAWGEGRREALREQDIVERDGPFKIKCELCDSKYYYEYFGDRISESNEYS